MRFVYRQTYGSTSDWGNVNVDGHSSIRRTNCVGEGECLNTCFVHKIYFVSMPMCAQLIKYMGMAGEGVCPNVYILTKGCVHR